MRKVYMVRAFLFAAGLLGFLSGWMGWVVGYESSILMVSLALFAAAALERKFKWGYF